MKKNFRQQRHRGEHLKTKQQEKHHSPRRSYTRIKQEGIQDEDGEAQSR